MDETNDLQYEDCSEVELQPSSKNAWYYVNKTISQPGSFVKSVTYDESKCWGY